MEYKATIIGTDPKSDLAVLQIEARGLSDMSFGDSDKLRVGEWVIAVGSPFSANLSHTVTAGIVSAKGRGNIIQGDVYEDFIQTDAAINPGNSGGALVNTSGDLIGINTAIYTNGFDRSNKGVGFAIPANMVKKVMSLLFDIVENVKKILSIELFNSAQALNLKKPLQSSESIQKGPAKKAGIQNGDVIIEFNEVEVNSVDHLRNTVSSSAPNKQYDLIVIRDGRKKTIKVTLEELPGDEVLLSSNQSESTNELGLQVSELTRSSRREYGIGSRDEGVIVMSVKEGSVSANAGIQVGDLITRVGTKKCKTPQAFKRLLEQTRKRGGKNSRGINKR